MSARRTAVLNTLLAASLLLAGAARAQQPAAPPAPLPPGVTKEQMQQAMARQMQLMAAMFDVRKSKLGFEDTVAALKSGAEKRGWKVDGVQDVQADMHKAGVKDARRMKVVNGCPADINDKLARAGQGKVPPLPCRYTVYDDADGKARVVKLNTAMLARATQGEVARLLAEVAAEEDALLRGLTE